MGYRYQYHVILLTALDLWSGATDRGVDKIVVEGRPGADKVDFALVGRSADDSVVIQVKSRWGAKAWSPRELLDQLISLGRDTTEPARLELVANGTFSEPARRLIELLDDSDQLDDDVFAGSLTRLGLGGAIDTIGLVGLRHARVTVRPGGLIDLRNHVRTRLRALRAASGQPVSDQAAELLRAYLLGLAMNKAEAEDVEGRTLRREEFLDAVAARKETLEHALASRWGVPVLLADRARSVRRPALDATLAEHLTLEDHLHAIDGTIRSSVLVGPAGIGKTTLAQQYALDNAAEFDWIYQLNADGDADAATAVTDVFADSLEQFADWLERLGIRMRRGQQRSPAQTAREVSEALARSTRTWLLIVDNAPSADLLADLLPASGYGVVLVTTRNSGWHGPQPIIRVGAFTPDEGRVLVQRRLADVPVTVAEAGRLCDALDGYALSLVTATSYLRSTRQSVTSFLGALADEEQRVAALDFPLQRLEDYPRTAVAAVHLALRNLRARAGPVAADALTALERTSVVLPDRIPTTLVSSDIQVLNNSIAGLAELSLLDRWQDQDGRDWVSVHRVIQDVVYAELVKRPNDLRSVLGAVEQAVTEGLRTSIERADLVTAGALRSHAVAFLRRLRAAGTQTWRTTTALLANAATAAQLQGDLAQAQRLLTEALDLLPDDDRDPGAAHRRGKTLTSLAVLQLEHDDLESARSNLRRAERAHHLHRLHSDHYEALAECVALRSCLDARATTDVTAIRTLFDDVRSLPTPTFATELARAVSLVTIAREMRGQTGIHPELRESAETLLGLVSGREAEHPVPAAAAHLGLLETHGSEGDVPAALRHYNRANELLTGIEGMDPAATIDNAIDSVLNLLSTSTDEVTGYPYRTIEVLIHNLLIDLSDRVEQIDWNDSQRDWVPARLQLVKALHAARNGLVDKCDRHFRESERLARNSQGRLPQNLVKGLHGGLQLRELAAYQQERRHGLAPSASLAESPAAPTSSSASPTPCLHFDSWQAPPSASDGPATAGTDEESDAEIPIDRVSAVTSHTEALTKTLGLVTQGISVRTAAAQALASACDDPEKILPHLIGAWRLIETMSYQVSDITGDPIDDVQDQHDTTLIDFHHDQDTDAIPSRAVLRCLDGRWNRELRRILNHVGAQGALAIITHFLQLEWLLVERLSNLTGESLDTVINTAIAVTRQFDDVLPYQPRRSYDSSQGTIVIGQTITGEPATIRLHDPDSHHLDCVWITGGVGAGKSNFLRVIMMESILSGVFCVFPSDPRDNHDFAHEWQSLVPNPAWIATNVRDTLRNLEAAIRVIDARSTTGGSGPLRHERPGILFAIDDADDIVQIPRGRALLEDLVARGPKAGVGLVAVLRDLSSLRNSEVIGRSVATSVSTIHAGQVESEGWKELRASFGP